VDETTNVQMISLEIQAFLFLQGILVFDACFLDKSCCCMNNLNLNWEQVDFQKECSNCETKLRWINSTESITCLKKHPLVFIGDSRMNYLYKSHLKHLCATNE